MLTHLSIENFRLVPSLHLTVNSGLTIISGETGAGKSMILDALGLLAGERAEPDMVRNTSSAACLTGSFDHFHDLQLENLCEEASLPYAQEWIIRRTLHAGGNFTSKAFINDTPVSVTFLKRFMSYLMNRHTQGDVFLFSGNQTRLLDRYCQPETLVQVHKAYEHMEQSHQRLVDAKQRFTQGQEQLHFLDHAIQELEELTVQEEEEALLLTQRHQAHHYARLSDIWNTLSHLCTASQGAIEQLRQAHRCITRTSSLLGTHGEKLMALLDPMLSYGTDLEVLIEDEKTRHHNEPLSLEAIDDRLGLLRAAARKYDVSVNDLPALAQTYRQQRAALETSAETLEELEKEYQRSKEQYQHMAKRQSEERRQGAQALTQGVNELLSALKLEGMHLSMKSMPLAQEEWGETGWERWSFFLQTHPQDIPRPLHKVASGGEMSRILLALKTVSAAQDGAATLIFDEIDTGTGGAAAQAIGRCLHQLAQDHQVITITHAPQVSCHGHHHWKVTKHPAHAGMPPVSTITVLNPQERVEEIARMLSGEHITPQALQAAQALCQEASSPWMKGEETTL